MENATKALIIIGSVLITVMLAAFMMYMFKNASLLPKSNTEKAKDLMIQSFNSQFSIYETADEISYGTDTSKKVKFSSLGNFGHNTASTVTDTKDNLIRLNAYKELNTVSDVITAVNLATSVNYKNNNSYKYSSSLETTNSVEIIIDLSNIQEASLGLKKYYVIEPNSNVKSNYVYEMATEPGNKSSNLNNFSTSNPLSTYTLLEKLRESTVFNKEGVTLGKNYTVYKYYFIGSYKINSTTGKIDSVKFKAIRDDGFGKVKES